MAGLCSPRNPKGTSREGGLEETGRVGWGGDPGW